MRVAYEVVETSKVSLREEEVPPIMESRQKGGEPKAAKTRFVDSSLHGV